MRKYKIICSRMRPIPNVPLMVIFSESGETQEKNEQSADDPNQAQSEAQLALAQFWPKVMEEIKSVGNV